MTPNERFVLNQFWVCPKCGSGIATGPPAKLHPPKCGVGHKPVEMEQSTAPAFGEAGR